MGMQMWHLLCLLRSIPHFAQICIRFAQSKFGANPFFRQVGENWRFHQITRLLHRNSAGHPLFSRLASNAFPDIGSVG